MQRLILKNANQLHNQKKAATLASSNLQKMLFATSPQPNPYEKTKKSLTVGGEKYSLYKLPELGDSRVGNIIHYLLKTLN